MKNGISDRCDPNFGCAAFAAVIGFDRERAFYSTVLIVIASYYALFAVMGASTRTLIIESIVAGVFVLFAALGFKRNFWLVVAALIGHGVFDFVRHFFIDNRKVKEELGGKGHMMLGSEASEITGHSVGAITPLCLGSLLPVFFDIGLKRFEEVVTAGGSTHAAIRIPLTRFAQLTGATWVDVCKEM